MLIQLYEKGHTDFEKNKAAVCDGGEFLDITSYEFLISKA